MFSILAKLVLTAKLTLAVSGATTVPYNAKSIQLTTETVSVADLTTGLDNATAKWSSR